MCITKCKIDEQCKIKAYKRASKSGAMGQPIGIGWGGRWEGVSGWWRTQVYLWLIHVDVWQNTSQYCNYPPIKINK